MAMIGNLQCEQPFQVAKAITLSDVTVYGDSAQNPYYDAFFCGVGGNVNIVDQAGNTTLLKGCVTGTVYRIRAVQFKSTSTTATDLVGLRW